MKKAIVSFLRNKLFDKIYVTLFSHVKIDYERTIIVCIIIALFFALAFTFLDLRGADWDIAVILHSSDGISQRETPSVNDASLETIKWRWGGFQIGECFSWFVFAFLIIVLGLLRVEKKNNRKLHFDERRRLDAFNAGFATELLSFIQGRTIIHKSSKDWNIPQDPSMRGKYLSSKLNELSSNIFMQYNNICYVIGQYLERHIREKNCNDTIHVSIKAFISFEKDKMKVVTFGLYNSNGHPNGNNGGNIHASIMTRLRDAYYIREDYAMTRIAQTNDQPSVFLCSDINKLKEDQQKETNNDPAGKYRTPCSRQFNATIVIPIGLIDVDSPDEFSVIGAVCVDTTNAYEDWKEHDSYEEQLMSFAAATVAELLQRNIKECEMAQEKISETGMEG